MSDREAEERPLTRRERRLREMAETGALPTVPAAEQEARAAAQAALAPDDGIEISPFDDEGRPRSRREMRELREQALAERAADAVVIDDADAESVPGENEPDGGSSAAGASSVAKDTRVEAEATPEVEAALIPEAEVLPDEADSRFAATQELSLQELLEAESEAAESTRVEVEPGTAAEEVEAVLIEEPEADSEESVEAEGNVEAEPEASAQPVSAAAKSGYSFPDIAPLEESISVFDDPASRTVATPLPNGLPPRAAGEGDFDDLISRAVAQEGAASTSNTSALILPSLPDTGELAGPLGETGELFITGSIELPKSLGETGGHAALHDSIEIDPIDELAFGDETLIGADDAIAPVSAARAVSARETGGPVVKQEVREKNKLPLVLILTGGGLVVAVVGLVVWGASSGLFG